MSAILALSAMHYLNMRNNSALAIMNNNNARLNSIAFMGGESAGSLGMLAQMDTNYELAAIVNSLQYKTASKMLEQIKKLQKEDAKNINFLA